MKLLEALKNVDQSEDNSQWVDVEELCRALGIDSWLAERPEDADTRLKRFWLKKWYCSDTWVGITAIFFDGELVGMTEQVARKADMDFTWVNRESADKVWDYLRPKLSKVDGYISTTDEIPETDNVNYVSQILIDDGFYEGMPCTVVRDDLFQRNRRAYKFDGDGQDINVIFEDNSTKQIHVTDFFMPLCLKKDEK